MIYRREELEGNYSGVFCGIVLAVARRTEKNDRFTTVRVSFGFELGTTQIKIQSDTI
jgi:hypothetical protein